MKENLDEVKKKTKGIKRVWLEGKKRGKGEETLAGPVTQSVNRCYLCVIGLFAPALRNTSASCNT
jgi:hypothetical protein